MSLQPLVCSVDLDYWIFRRKHAELHFQLLLELRFYLQHKEFTFHALGCMNYYDIY